MATTVHVDANGGTRYSVIVTKGQYSGTGSAVYPGFWVNQNCVFGAIRYLRADGSNADSRSSITSGVTGIDLWEELRINPGNIDRDRQRQSRGAVSLVDTWV